MTRWLINALGWPDNQSMRVAVRIAYVAGPLYLLYLIAMVSILRGHA